MIGSMKHGFLARLLVVVATLGVLGGLSGCSSFRGDAHRYASGAAVPAPGSVEGSWEGQWSDAKRPNHGGELRCVLTRTGDHLYRLSSRSRWWRWFSSSLDATVVVTPTAPGQFEIRGGRGIWPFGDYRIEGRVVGDTLEAVYRAGGHQGRIQLRRIVVGDRG